ncbi:hypothetical protein FisN_12Lh120 [Fistulifera solaris]|uniref:BTB domain-containing protein n=1 Tax=Fistulifera solaris TaxID=1519565 RepID=A0A1Z5JME1_FISSO|nr:hypothetical protein FisN_12Lh120 [Fistulifera solaris]|eukprot:GAX15177.1 hypothetical protein FisN_12Lh120 [Fistulifera solaris]
MVRDIHHESTLAERSYFDPEGDNEIGASGSADESHTPLSWRGDPNETLADWAIVIVTNELETVTYNVHKNVVCFGSRYSRYFAKVMTNGGSSSNVKKSNRKGGVTPFTKVEMDQKDADNFPIVLDYMYASCSYMASSGTIATATSNLTAPTLTSVGTDEECSNPSSIDGIRTENAVSLRYLAKLFEIEPMILAVNKFIQKDLDFTTGPTYLCAAAEYKDSRLMESAQRLCAENIEEINSKALMKLPLNLFRTVIKSLESFEDDNKHLSCFLSELVCRYLEKHRDNLTAGLLLEFTDPILMPYIASEAAIGFTALIKELHCDDAKSHWDDLVALGRRCAQAVVREYGWNDFCVDAAIKEYLMNMKNAPNESGPKTQIDSLLFATSFAAALDQAQEDFEELHMEQEKLQGMVSVLHETVVLLEKASEKKDQYLEKQNRALEAARNEIQRLQDQILDEKSQQVHRHLMPQYSEDSAFSPSIKKLVSPSRLVELDIHAKKKTKRIKELRTKNEMRSHSLLP